MAAEQRENQPAYRVRGRQDKPRGEEWPVTDLPDTRYVSTPPKLQGLGDPAAAAIRWRSRFENYLVAMRITEDSVKLMCLVEIGGEELEQVIEELPQELELETFEAVIKALNRHFDPFANPYRDVVLLRRTVQTEGELFERFYRRVRDLTSRCVGLDRAFEMRIQLLVGCESDKLREMCLRQPGIAISEILALGRALESESMHSEALAGDTLR